MLVGCPLCCCIPVGGPPGPGRKGGIPIGGRNPGGNAPPNPGGNGGLGPPIGGPRIGAPIPGGPSSDNEFRNFYMLVKFKGNKFVLSDGRLVKTKIFRTSMHRRWVIEE